MSKHGKLLSTLVMWASGCCTPDSLYCALGIGFVLRKRHSEPIRLVSCDAEVSHHHLGQVVFLTNYVQLAEQVSRTLPSKVDALELRDVDFKTALDVRASRSRCLARLGSTCRCCGARQNCVPHVVTLPVFALLPPAVPLRPGSTS